MQVWWLERYRQETRMMESDEKAAVSAWWVGMHSEGEQSGETDSVFDNPDPTFVGRSTRDSFIRHVLPLTSHGHVLNPITVTSIPAERIAQFIPLGRVSHRGLSGAAM